MTTTTIGTGGDYTTINTWEADAPAGALSAPWQGNCKNQEFNGGDGSGATISISGNTTTAANCKILTADTGASFLDNANKLTNALRYNASNGAAITNAAGFTDVVVCSESNVNITRLQIRNAGSGSTRRVIFNGNSAFVLANCIVEDTGATGSATICLESQESCTVTNNVFNQRTSGNNGVRFSFANVAGFYNNTLANTGGAGSSVGFQGNGGSGTVFTAKNNAVFGFATFHTLSAGSASGCSNNASDVAIGTGTSNQASKTYSSQFQNITDATRDFRAKDGDLDVNGVRDQTHTADLDIVGSARSTTTPTIGAWELAAAAAAKLNQSLIARQAVNRANSY